MSYQRRIDTDMPTALHFQCRVSNVTGGVQQVANGLLDAVGLSPVARFDDQMRVHGIVVFAQSATGARDARH